MEQFDHHSKHFAQHWGESYRRRRESCSVAHSELRGGFCLVTRCEGIRMARFLGRNPGYRTELAVALGGGAS